MRQTKLHKALENTVGEIEVKLREAKQDFRDIKKKATELHITHMISLDKAHAREKGTTEEIKKKLRNRIVTQREMGRAIARVKKKEFKPITKLYHTTTLGKIECTTQSDMATACIIENKKRFSQTIDTPPMHHSLVEVVGYNVEKEGGRQILEGIFEIPQNTPKYMTMVIDRLRMPQVVKRKGLLPTTITTAEHIQGWKIKRKEQHQSKQN